MTLRGIDIEKTLSKAQKELDACKDLPASLRSVIELLIILVGLFAAKTSANSRNSSKPPSQDPFRPKKSRATALKRKAGGQHGRAATFLEQVQNPDEIKPLAIDRRTLPRGKDFFDDGFEKRQVIGIKISRHVTEYRAERLVDSSGKKYVASFPAGVTHPTQYGPSIKAQSVYLSQFQLLPYERLTSYFSDQCKTPLSEGSVHNFNLQAFKRLEDFEVGLKARLRSEPVLHADETGINVLGKLTWLHSVGSQKLSLFYPHVKRGSEAMDEIGVLRGFTGVVCHDHWKAYFKYDVKHSLCNAHHLRELTAVYEDDGMKWAKRMHRLLLRMHQESEKKDGCIDRDAARKMIRKYRQILSDGDTECPPGVTARKKGQRGRLSKPRSRNLLGRLKNYETETLRFLVDPLVPFTNNAGERDIRMTKVQQKISGCFRTLANARTFCRIRSYLLTCQKHSISATVALEELFQGRYPAGVAYVVEDLAQAR